jgi:omega-6 fatty acid desaturase (delta-12 desaturase)
MPATTIAPPLPTPPRGETVKAVRDALPAEARARSTALGVAYFAATAAVYLATFAAIALADAWWARFALALTNGLAAGMLFIVGHDACHGSLTPRPALNAWLGRAAFLPSLHPYVAWAYSHNALPNLRGRDPVYAPLTLEEYRALPAWRQRLERLCRSWAGVLPLYLYRIWWPLEIRPDARHRASIDKRGSFALDRALVLAFPPAQALALVLIARAAGVSGVTELAAVAALGVAVPFLAFTWLMGFATFQHHTHPRVIWYDDEAEWSYFRAQVQGTVHVEFPRWVELLLHNIMEHTAHHVDTRVPLYHLAGAQRAVEAAYGEENVIVEPFSFAGMTRTFRACQLYDYRAHRWLSFDGEPTTPARSLAAEASRSEPAAV